MVAMEFLFVFIIALCATSATSATVPSVTTAQCESLKAPIEGMVQCSRNSTLLKCTAACNTGFVFDTNETVITRQCDDTTGTWNDGSDLPSCVSNVCRSVLLPTVNDSKITASSVWTGVKGYAFGPERARLNSKVAVVNQIVQSGGWRPAANTLNQYIQVEFDGTMRITGIVTQGRAVFSGDTANEYVTRFRVLYSMDGKMWQPYSSETVSDQFLDGNYDNNRIKSNTFSCPFDAKYIRINPLAWHENIALRFEVFGCPPDSSKPACLSSQGTVAPPVDPHTTMPTTVQQTTMGRVPTKPADMCSALAPPLNGAINCEKRATQLVCVANCLDGFIFESNELLIKRVCMKDTGAWTSGSSIPRCIYNTQPTPLAPTHNFTNGCITLQKECDNTGNGDYQACGGCHFFASCSEGFLYVRACPENLLFDASSGLCDYHSSSCPAANEIIG